jgi:hypothetical protein
MYYLIYSDVDSNSVPSNAGDPMANTDVDMTEGAPKMSSEEASAQVPVPSNDSVDADVDADSRDE